MDELASLHVGVPVVRGGAVGIGPHEKPASYALVDVTNQGPRDLWVSLGGALVDSSGRRLSAVRPEVLVVPGHGVRTFALVADPPAVVSGVASVVPEILRSEVWAHPPAVVVDEGHVFADQGRVVVKARAVNQRQGRARAVVIGGFYDGDKRPMERKFTVVDIDGGQGHAIEFVGPQGSKSAYIFVGDVSY